MGMSREGDIWICIEMEGYGYVGIGRGIYIEGEGEIGRLREREIHRYIGIYIERDGAGGGWI